MILPKSQIDKFSLVLSPLSRAGREQRAGFVPHRGMYGYATQAITEIID